MTRAIAVALGLLSVLTAQQRNALRVKVIDSVRESELADASIEFRPGDDKLPTVRASTGPDGTVAVPDLTAGIYRAYVKKDGFRAIDPLGTEVTWQNSTTAPTLVLVMVEEGSIAGRVIDEDGKPMEKVLIETKRPGVGLMTMTDPRGVYRFDHIEPGTYRISARPQPSEQGTRVPVYYPGDRNAASVEPITLRPGERLTGRDFRLRSVRAFAISGLVRDERGRPASGISLVLNPAGATYILGKAQHAVASKSEAEGRFRFVNVGEGDWDLIAAQKSADGVELRGHKRIHIARVDIENLSLSLNQPFDLDVISVWLDGGSPDPVRGAPQIMLIPVDGPDLFQGYSGKRGVREFYPGRYRIVAGARSGDYLAAVRLGETDVRGQDVYIGPESPPIRLEYAKNGGRFSGGIENAKTCTVIARPVEFDTPNHFTVLDCDTSGAFRSDILRPGRYRVWAFDRFDYDAWVTPAFRDMFEQLATGVAVDAGVTVSVDLRLRSWPF